jgi:hypothetical protein
MSNRQLDSGLYTISKKEMQHHAALDEIYERADAFVESAPSYWEAVSGSEIIDLPVIHVAIDRASCGVEAAR